MRVVFGFAGEMASGKGTATELIKCWFPGTPSVRFSDSLRKCYAELREICTSDDIRDEHKCRFLVARGLIESFHFVPAHRQHWRSELRAFINWLSSEFIAAHQQGWTKEASTADLQALSTSVRTIFGEDALERAVIARITSLSSHEFVIIEGIRRNVDIVRLRKDPSVCLRLVYVTADAHVRHERHRLRNEKPGDAALSFEEFTLLGMAEAESEIRSLAIDADAVIDNSKTPEDFALCLRALVDAWRV